VGVGLQKEIKEQERTSIATSGRSTSERLVTDSKQNRRVSLSNNKSRSNSERSIAERKQRQPSLIFGTGKSKSERIVTGNVPQDTQALERRSRSGRSRAAQRISSSKSGEKSGSKLPLTTQDPSKRRGSGRSKSVQRSGGASKFDEKELDSNLPSETKEAERRGRGRIKSTQRCSGSKFREKADSKLPPLTKNPQQRGRTMSKRAPPISNKSNERDDSKLPPETKARKKQALRRRLITEREVNDGERRKHEVKIPQEEPSNADAFSDARNDTIDESFVSHASYLNDEQASKAETARVVSEQPVSPMSKAKRPQLPSPPVGCRSEDQMNAFIDALLDGASDTEEPTPVPVRCASEDLMNSFIAALIDDTRDAEEPSENIFDTEEPAAAPRIENKKANTGPTPNLMNPVAHIPSKTILLTN